MPAPVFSRTAIWQPFTHDPRVMLEPPPPPRSALTRRLKNVHDWIEKRADCDDNICATGGAKKTMCRLKELWICWGRSSRQLFPPHLLFRGIGRRSHFIQGAFTRQTIWLSDDAVRRRITHSDSLQQNYVGCVQILVDDSSDGFVLRRPAINICRVNGPLISSPREIRPRLDDCFSLSPRYFFFWAAVC
jgi:hypothetical protein